MYTPFRYTIDREREKEGYIYRRTRHAHVKNVVLNFFIRPETDVFRTHTKSKWLKNDFICERGERDVRKM